MIQVEAPGEGKFCAPLCTGSGSCAAPLVSTVLRWDTDGQPLWDGFLLGTEVGERPFWNEVT